MKKVYIFAIPFAGGNKYSYERFRQHLPLNFILKTLEFPGRGDRMDEDNLSDIVQLAKDILLQIRDDINKTNYVIYGHSMGALVGYELIKEILRLKLNVPTLLFCTGSSAPSTNDDDEISTYDSQAFWQEIFEMGGVPDEVRTNDDILDFLEPVFRSDIRAIERYEYQPMNKPFNIPIHVMSGIDDADISVESLNAWQQETGFPIKKQLVPGGHFFIFENVSFLVDELVTTYELYSKSSLSN